MGYVMLRRTRRRLLIAVAAVLAVAAFFLVWLEAGRRDPAQVPQEQWYDLGTQSAKLSFTPLPRPHEVVIVPVTDTLAVQVLGMLERMQAGGNVAQRGGRFDAATGRITILSEDARFEAAMPPLLQPHFRHVLRHEYGHALLYDWLCSRMGREQAMEYFEATGIGGVPRNEAFPEELRPTIREFQTLRHGTVYGDVYFTTTFDEYLAESYARFLDGDHVPPRVSGLLQSLSSPR